MLDLTFKFYDHNSTKNIEEIWITLETTHTCDSCEDQSIYSGVRLYRWYYPAERYRYVDTFSGYKAEPAHPAMLVKCR